MELKNSFQPNAGSIYHKIVKLYVKRKNGYYTLAVDACNWGWKRMVSEVLIL
jgi:hypothetical protein